MTELIANGLSRSRSSSLTGVSRSMIYYRHRERKPKYDVDLERRISHVVEEGISYGTMRVAAMIRRSGVRMGRNRIRRHMRHMNLIATHKKVHRKHGPKTIVVARPNAMWETDFPKIYNDGEGWIYFTAYLDLCSRKIGGYLVSRMPRTAETMEAVDNALLSTFHDLKINGLRIRSDNGSQLTSSVAHKTPLNFIIFRNIGSFTKELQVDHTISH